MPGVFFPGQSFPAEWPTQGTPVTPPAGGEAGSEIRGTRWQDITGAKWADIRGTRWEAITGEP